MNCLKKGRENETVPSLHVRLAVLLGRGVVVLQSLQTCAGHEEEGDVLDVVDILLVRVLRRRSVIYAIMFHNLAHALKILRMSKSLTTRIGS